MSVIHDVWWTAAVDASRGEWVDAVSGLDGRISDDIISADPTRVRPKKKKNPSRRRLPPYASGPICGLTGFPFGHVHGPELQPQGGLFSAPPVMLPRFICNAVG